jgi:hypothetical protein
MREFVRDDPPIVVQVIDGKDDDRLPQWVLRGGGVRDELGRHVRVDLIDISQRDHEDLRG